MHVRAQYRTQTCTRRTYAHNQVMEIKTMRDTKRYFCFVSSRCMNFRFYFEYMCETCAIAWIVSACASQYPAWYIGFSYVLVMSHKSKGIKRSHRKRMNWKMFNKEINANGRTWMHFETVVLLRYHRSSSSSSNRRRICICIVCMQWVSEWSECICSQCVQCRTIIAFFCFTARKLTSSICEWVSEASVSLCVNAHIFSFAM